ncbi:MAG: alpha/beta hydrolase [Henriciella sp.]|nr:alpha/beta hydrolase [Henriciella sp.]
MSNKLAALPYAFCLGVMSLTGCATAEEAPATAEPEAAEAQTSSDLQIPPYVLSPGRMVDIGGYSLNTYCFGEGSPTVVFEAGGGWGAVAWANIQPLVAQKTRACSYDRAGMNFSEFGPLERPPGQDRIDLETWLEAAGEEGPFVLVGWSAGGMISRDFAWSSPEKVVGVVITDGSVFDFEHPNWNPEWRARSIEIFEECKAAAAAGTLEDDAELYGTCESIINPVASIPPLQEAFKAKVLAPEKYDQFIYGLSNMETYHAALKSQQQPFADIPVHILIAGEHAQTNAETGELQNPSYIQYNYQIAQFAKDARVEIIPNTDHMIHFPNPEPLLRAINEVVDKVRAKAPSETD